MPSTVPCARRVLLLVAAAATAMMAVPTASSALSCAGHPDATPRAIAEGTEELSVDGTFRELYDGAIFGTVVSMRTQNDGEQPDYGRTEVVVDVTGTFGPQMGGRAVVVEDDPGWLNGHAFEVGTHYFIPYVLTEEGTYSHLCDPIAEVDPADVPELVELAEENASTPHASDDSRMPTQAADADNDQQPTEDNGEPASSSGAGTIWVWGLLALLGVSVAAGLRARNRSHQPEDVSARHGTEDPPP